METINDTNQINRTDLMLATYAIGQVLTLYTNTLESGDGFEGVSEEETKETLEQFASTHAKFTAALQAFEAQDDNQEE
jgi:hypothetical protein|tara:strand:+ start:168 stop:401 length:234 start_codon:yes stop_codon:yes gene_type:complete